MSSKKLVWFITGTSQGFGRELVRAALDRGDSVVATSREPLKVAEHFKNADRLLALSVDLREHESVEMAVASALERFGRVDVLVNNAGHGLLGAIEEISEEEARSMFELNVFGLIRMTRAVLPHFRKQRSGHVVNLSSIGGLVGLPGWGLYNASKFAVEGLSEALNAEASALGIRVTVVEPGPFRTDFLGGSLSTGKVVIDDYKETSGKTRAAADTRNGRQPGDPAKAADAIVTAVLSDKPPLHLVLGQFAFDRYTQKLDEVRAEMALWKAVSVGSDFPAGT
jgi:NAD(P)-dependent dehydrogenase (short-subunit alcohol dehydrogenase family)